MKCDGCGCQFPSKEAVHITKRETDGKYSVGPIPMTLCGSCACRLAKYVLVIVLDLGSLLRRQSAVGIGRLADFKLGHYPVMPAKVLA